MKTNCLLLTSFLKELDLTDEQKPKFLAIQKAMTAKSAEFQKLPAKERKQKQRSGLHQAVNALSAHREELTPELLDQ